MYTKGDKASIETMNRQIYRLIGKATTLAASVPDRYVRVFSIAHQCFPLRSMAYRVRQGRNFVTTPVGLSYTGS